MPKNTKEKTNNECTRSDEACFVGVSSYVGGLGGGIGSALVSSIATGTTSTTVTTAGCLTGCVVVPAVVTTSIVAYKLFGMFCVANKEDEQESQEMENSALNNPNQLSMGKS